MSNFVPLYRQVSQRIFRKIEQGVYKFGDRIPSEKELADHYGVNRLTVRRAIGLLAERGVLKSRQGKGVFVTNTFYEARLGSGSALFDEAFFQDPRLSQRSLFTTRTQAGRALGDLFQLPPNAELWLAGRQWVAEDMAVALEYSYFPLEWIPDFSAGLQKIPWETLFRQRRLLPERLEETIRGVRLWGEEARLLQMRDGSAAFAVHQLVWMRDRRLLRFTKLLAEPQKITHYLKQPVLR